MNNEFIELKYLQAKEDLVKFINDLPKKYGVSFIFINEMLTDITNQVNNAASNDRRTLEILLYNTQNKEKIKKEKVDE